MSKHKTGNGKNNSDNVPPSKNSPNHHRANRIDQNSSSDTPEETADYQPVDKKNFWLNDINNQPIIANIISFAMVVATGFLVWYTIGILNQTSKSADATKLAAEYTLRAAIATENGAKIQKQSLEDQRAFKKQSDKSDSEKLNRDVKFIKKQSQGIDAQIASLKETQKEFEIESRPFIIINNLATDTFSVIRKNIKYAVAITNMGKQPAHIIKCFYDFKFSTDSNFNSFEGISEHSDKEGSYYANNEAFNCYGETFFKTDQWFDYYKSNICYVYFRGKISYKSFSTDKLYFLNFIYRVQVSKRQEAKTVFYKIN